MKNVLSLTAKEARVFFLKEESYFNFDLPPYFEFNGLLEKILKMMGDKKLSDFYDQNIKPQELEDVNYKLITNKDGRYAWRPLQLIHPAFYVNLVCLITAKNNWKQIKSRMNKLIKDSRNIECEGLPVVSTYYKKDKAAQIVHWSTEVEKKSIVNSLGFDYLFHTDIIDCYSSIYTHTIPWALHDKVKAKKEKGNKKLVGNLIDWQLQGMSNGQTNGIPQGSVLVDFLAEIVLCYVDNLLSEKIKSLKKSEYKIIRYRDDYRIFTNNPQIAEQIIKELTDILNDFGMKINSSKTKGSNNVIHSSIKPDKLEWIINENTRSDLQSELYAISVFSEKFPNSGTIVIQLKNFYDKISKLTKKDKKGNVKVLISITTDIAYKNPRTYPITAAILSKLIDFLSRREKERVVKKILTKFEKMPNTGIMQLWLQRITIKIGNGYNYSEKLCNKVVDKNTAVWNSDWLNPKLKKTINSYNLVNEDTLKKLGAVISNEEVELFKIAEYPY